jgi:exonuclease SbcD
VDSIYCDISKNKVQYPDISNLLNATRLAIMKILHTSDWHLGKILHEHSMVQDQEYFLGWLVEQIQQDDYDTLVVAGDIYDRSLPPADAVSMLSAFFKDLRTCTEIPVIMIPGNHDSARRLSYCAELISVSGIYIKTDPADVDKPVIVGDADFYCIPYLDPYLVSLPDEHDNDGRTHEAVMRYALEKTSRVMDDSRINICVAHCFARGGSPSDSERVFVGTSGAVPGDLFSGFDYTILGHLHRPQMPGPAIAYSGSPLKYSFSEADDKKSVFCADVDKKGVTVTRIATESMRGLSRISGLFSDLLSDPVYDPVADHYLEIELLDRLVPLNPLQQLQKRFPWILSIRRKSYGSGSSDIAVDDARGEHILDDFSNFLEYIRESDDLVKQKRELFESGLARVQSGDDIDETT